MFVNFSWGQKATLPKWLKSLDRKGFTDEVASRCGKDREYLINYINSLIGKDYDVDSEPNVQKTKNYVVGAKLSKVQSGTGLAAHKNTNTEVGAKDTGFESTPDVDDDNIPF
jgi:hypothetical protein